MRIDLAVPTSLGLLGRGAGMIPEWRVGSIVQALAVRDAATGQLWLEIGAHRLQARIASGDTKGPAHGETLNLKVLRNHPVLAFETIDATGTAIAEDPALEALRRVLPRQASPTPLLANMSWLTRNDGHRNTGNMHVAVPERIAEAVRVFWQAVPEAETLADADSWTRVLGNSGMFLEAKLAATESSGTQPAAQDLKALLLSLRAALLESGARLQVPVPAQQPSPAPLPMLHGALEPLRSVAANLSSAESAQDTVDTLYQQTEGALARMTATQLTNAAAHGLAWLVEVPVRFGDDVQLLRFRFEREARAREPARAEDADIAVETVLTLSASETLHARIVLRSQRISVQLRSDSPALVTALQEASGNLARSLQAAGLNVDQILCLHGLPVQEGGRPAARLLNVRA